MPDEHLSSLNRVGNAVVVSLFDSRFDDDLFRSDREKVDEVGFKKRQK